MHLLKVIWLIAGVLMCEAVSECSLFYINFLTGISLPQHCINEGARQAPPMQHPAHKLNIDKEILSVVDLLGQQPTLALT